MGLVSVDGHDVGDETGVCRSREQNHQNVSDGMKWFHIGSHCIKTGGYQIASDSAVPQANNRVKDLRTCIVQWPEVARSGPKACELN